MKASPVLLSLAVRPFLVAEATWSIVAIDKRTDRIGAAMATCLDHDRFPENAANFLAHGFSAYPYRGGIMAQANIQDETGPAATAGRATLDGGTLSAWSVVDAMTDPKADPGDSTYTVNDGGSRTYPNYELRQYGVVTYDEADPVAAYTGSKLTQLYGAFGFANTEETVVTGVTKKYTVSVQGNIVYPGTVDATYDAFVDGADFGGEEEFPERLFHALKAGYEATGGDVRCAYDAGLKGAVLAFLKVAEPAGGRSIDLEAKFGGTEGRSALDAIEEGLAAWREDRDGGGAEEPAEESAGATQNTVEIAPSKDDLDPAPAPEEVEAVADESAAALAGRGAAALAAAAALLALA